MNIEERIKAEMERDNIDEIEREIKNGLNDIFTAYSFGAKTREDVEKQIAYYEEKYNFDGRDRLIKKLDRMEASKNNSKKHIKKSSKLVYVIAVVFLIVVLAVLAPQLSNSNKVQRNEQMPEAHYHQKEKDPQYTTYYDDENGNGQFDKGEWNWTEDENGNTVDIDNDGSNF